MAKLAIYRKYRPKLFSEFIGQEHITRTISNAIAGNMVSHAYLFSGPRGTGKTTLARLLAKAVNCENRNGFEPCNKCASCKEIDNNRAMDLVEIDAASNRGIDDIRELRDNARFIPSKLKYKVFIIDECHQLSNAASNALLKTLEEPPKHAIFILATTEIYKMLATILSRCQRFDFKKLSVSEIIEKIEKDAKAEKVKIDKAALKLIAQAARGSIRDAESMLDQVLTFNPDKIIEAEEVKAILGLIETQVISQLIDLLLKKDKKQSIIFLNKTLERGIDAKELNKAIINYLRQGLIIKVASGENDLGLELTEQEIEKLKTQISSIEQEQIIKALDIFIDANSKIRYSPIPQLPIELAILSSCEIL